MELFRSEYYYIFVKNESSLWWNRSTGSFSVKSAWDLSEIEDIECLGITDGIIGQIEHGTILEPRLVIIKESVPVGQIYFHHTISKIKSIAILCTGEVNDDLELSVCTKHGSSNPSVLQKQSSKRSGGRMFENSAFLNKTIGTVRNVGNTIKTTTQQAASQVKETVKKQKDPKIAERFEKRITDELHKIFDDTDSFYYSRTLDITNTLQRQYEVEKKLESEEDKQKPITDVSRWWKHVDDRFFWNKHMLKDIIALGSPACNEWILPIIQGFVRLEQIPVSASDTTSLNLESLSNASLVSCDETFTLGIISRRSRYQAGTRYNRRGVEPNGKVANYVETEQIVSIICSDSIHRASFVQVRGSVPVFWSQPQHKFRPPPRLDRTEEESYAAFKNHIKEELQSYNQVCIVNLVDQQGREKIIFEAFGNHVLKYNSADLIYVTFDFHEYCRGMHYENVGVLINAIADIITDMRFCWRDNQGLICKQNSVFRVNCIDCLDRTNVVQTAIAKFAIELQLCRLGLAAPGQHLPAPLRTAFLTMWADNGDALSRQYAGTKALKGDYTRTGERKFSGMMKDGVASANRFFICHFGDAITQFAYDVCLGQPIREQTIEEYDSYWRDVSTAAMMVIENLDLERGKLEMMPSYFGHGLTKELISVEIAYGMGRYYLSTFKDALRQAAIDVMTGETKELPEQLIMPPDVKCQMNVHTLLHEQTFPDTAAMAQHVKSLIDDCKKLIVDTEPVLGSWGLIDADPNTGDPSETEMDSVLILTNSAYYVTEYDETSDRLLGVRRVPLSDITSIELGVPNTNSALFSVTRKPAAEPIHCIRINYTYNKEAGYFHMFRSTALRFFNNMAVAINTKDEMIESLHSICESIMVARDVAKLPPIPFNENVKLERKKSKSHPSENESGGSRSSIYLDLSRLPTLTRNVSETQLVADIRSVVSILQGSPFKSCHNNGLLYAAPINGYNASVAIAFLSRLLDSTAGRSLNINQIIPSDGGSLSSSLSSTSSVFDQILWLGNGEVFYTTVSSKALNNMTEQFSKLNKLSHSLNARARPSLQLKFDQSTSRPKKIFTLGQNKTDSRKKGSLSDGMSSDYSSDDDNRTNIFEPTLDNFENTQVYIGKGPGSSKVDKNDEIDCDLIENPLYSSKIEPKEEEVFKTEEIQITDKHTIKTPSNVNKMNPFDMDLRKTPEIQIEHEGTSKPAPPSSLQISQKLSQSSCEINCEDLNQADGGGNYHVRSNSQHDITLSIAQSHSESALKQLKNIASPVSSTTRDMVLSPLSKFAKGVQNFGANLDPRKIKGTSNAVKQITEQQYEEHKKLQEKWRDCNTRLIAL